MSGTKQVAEDAYRLIKSWERAREASYDPRTGIDALTDTLKLATNGIPNGKIKSIAREMLDEINAAGKLGVENIDRYQDRLREAAGDDGVPGFSPSTAPPAPPGMERQPTVVVSDNGRTFTQGPDLIVPIGSKLPNDRPYYVDGDGKRIYPPPGGWAEDGIPPDGTDPGTKNSVISVSIGTTPDPLVKTIRYIDPLVLDLDGDGLEITPLSKGVLFDANGDTIKTGTAWVGADDGMLVWDRNGNGLIDSGQELFGDETILANGKKAAHGFAALGELDAGSTVNGVKVGAGDGVFDAKDAEYANVRIWRDLNQDGISQAGELKTLAETGVVSINIGSVNSNFNYGDAILAQSGSFTRADDSSGQAGSFILAQNNFVREFSPIAINDASKALPDIKGSGWARDLREAATLSPELVELLDAAKNSPTRAGYKDAIAGLLREWGNGSDYSSASKQALSAGYGLILSESADDQEAGWMDTAIKASEADRDAFRATLSAEDLTKFDAMRERMVGGLEKIHAYEAFTGHTFLNWSQIQGDAVNYTPRFVQNGLIPVEMWVPFSQIIYENRNAFFAAQEGYIRINIPVPSSGMPHLETLWNRIVDDAMNNLMPSLRFPKYIDLIDLNIGSSSVVFDFGRLNEELDSVGATSVLEGVAVFLDLYRTYGSVFENLGWNGAQQLHGLMQRALSESAVRDGFTVAGFSLFTAGPVWSGTESGDAFAGDASKNYFSAGAGNDLLDGQAGNDYLSGGAGDDVIFGGDGNDSLYGGDGNDTLDGGSGDDLLSGGMGADTYLFGLGSGQDVISTYDGVAIGSNADTILLGAGITTTGVALTRQYRDLAIHIDGTVDSLTVQNYFNTDGASINAVRYLRFADGTVWDIAIIKKKLLAGTTGNDTLYGYVTNDTIIGGGGDDIIEGYAGDDALYGGPGADKVQGDDGSDTLDGGSGNDDLNGGMGADTYLFGIGSGQDIIFNYDRDAFGTNADTIVLGAGIATTGVALTRHYDDLLIRVNGTDDSLRVSGYFNNDGASNNAVEYLKFADGTVWDVATIKAKVLVATAGNDTLYGYATNNTLNGGGGNDVLYGNAGDDVLEGGTGYDIIYGDGGNDQLIGGEDDDFIYGHMGEDILDGGDGSDSLSGGGDDDILRGGVGDDDLQGGWGNDILEGGDGKDTLNGDAEDDLLDGGGGNDRLSGGNGNDTLRGGAGNDNILGDWGNDTLDGGADNDTLSGGEGNDIYLFGRGDGQDTIVGDLSFQEDKLNVVHFKPGVSAQDVIVQREDTALVLSIAGTEDQLRAWSFFDGNIPTIVFNPKNVFNPVQQVVFDDGTIWDTEALVALAKGASVLGGGQGDDTIVGTEAANVLVGNAGNDRLSGDAGNDTVQGGVGNDDLFGNAGDDVLDGGAGTDALNGGTGNDTYLFGRGDGQDTIAFDYADLEGKLNVLRFKPGVSAQDVTVRRAGDSLVVGIAGTTDQVTVENFFFINDPQNLSNPVQEVRFADGTTWDVNALAAMAMVGGTGNDTLVGTAADDVIDGHAGDDRLSGGAGNDTYLFGRGDGQDTITYDYAALEGKLNVLRFKPGVNAQDVTVRRAGDSLVVGIAGTTDQVTVENFFFINDPQNLSNPVQQLRFDDGTTWSTDALSAMAMVGGSGDDTLVGTGGADVIDGKAGNDRLSGKAGNDTYLFGRGDGQDTITYDYAALEGKFNVLRFKPGVNAQDVTAQRSGDSLVLGIAGTTDQVTVENFFFINDPQNLSNPVQQLRFDDGTTWSTDALSAMAMVGGAGDDTIEGTAAADVILGKAGNDSLYGRAGDDVLEGGAGFDLLLGEAGNDTLQGGTEGDWIEGGLGNDIYLFGRGDGADGITDVDATAGNVDTLQFLSGIASDQLWFEQVEGSSALRVSVIGTDDSATIHGWYDGAANHVEQFRTFDGKTLTDAGVANLVQAMASFSPPAAGQTTLPQDYADSLQPRIAANWQ